MQALGAGQSLVESITVRALDGTTQVITITINGTNDGAVIGGTVTGAVTEDVSVTGGELVVTGALTISDADAGQASFQTERGLDQRAQ